MNLNNLKIGKRLMLGFGAVIALTVMLIIVGWNGFNKVQSRYWKTSMLNSIQADFMAARLNSRLFVQFEEPQYAEKLFSAIKTVEENIARVSPTFKTKANQEQIARIKEELEKYKDAAEQYVKSAKSKQENLRIFDNSAKRIMEVLLDSRASQATITFMNARVYGQKYLRLFNEDDYKAWEKNVEESRIAFTGETDQILEEYQSAFVKVHEELKTLKTEESEFKAAGDVLHEEVDAATSSMSDQMVAEIRSAVVQMIALGVFAIILGIIFAVIISRSIKVGINKGVEIATTIAEGDVSVEIDRIDLMRNDEIGDLFRTLQKMVDKLRQVVESIVAGANNIASASEQTSSTAQELSQGASEQASSVEEISSTMEEMSANIQQNSDNAQQTEKIATLSSEGIHKVAVAAQNSLSSIKNISDKISIINDIAFQTNILALNAAVEAARAGEHGRGFAVVAAEVRKLAERSKLAANEIVDLSRSSVQVTEDAGNLMMSILPEIEKTAKLVQEIAAASLEQNNGSIQINSAIQQLNAITQQNASASEEMASNSEELSSQAEQLRETVSYFKLGANHTNKDFLKIKRTNSGISNFENRKTTSKGVAINLLPSEDLKDNEFSNF